MRRAFLALILTALASGATPGSAQSYPGIARNLGIVVAVNPSVPANALQEFIALQERQHPRRTTWKPT